uniref:Aspartokinase n=1 Tax=Aegilops tauschii subsp. strangulata TaxID=200361 RepID=A0A453MHS0_AEGTS
CSMLLVDMMIAHSLVAKKPVVCLSGVRHLAIQTMESSQLPGGISKCEGAEKVKPSGYALVHVDAYIADGSCFSPQLCDIGLEFYDAFDLGFITTDDFTNADILEATYPAVAKRLHGDWIDDPAIPVVTGFLGKGWKSCAVTTLGRGGSDLTATTIGKALGLREIQVWKDVDGVLTCDPNIYANAVPVPYLTFDEAAELAYFGAQVLHPQSMRPAREGGIPVRVKNSYNRHAPGTVITKTRDMRKSILTSIVLKSNITMLDIVSTRMLGQYGFLAKVFSIFEDLGISVDSVATSEVSISLTLDPSKLWSRELIQQELDNVVEELEKIAVVHLLQHRSIISLIGNVQRSSLILEKAFNVLRRNGVNVQMISQGASKVNISLVVNDSEAKQCVQALHSAFFENGFLSEVEEADLAQNRVPVLVSSNGAINGN